MGETGGNRLAEGFQWSPEDERNRLGEGRMQGAAAEAAGSRPSLSPLFKSSFFLKDPRRWKPGLISPSTNNPTHFRNYHSSWALEGPGLLQNPHFPWEEGERATHWKCATPPAPLNPPNKQIFFSTDLTRICRFHSSPPKFKKWKASPMRCKHAIEAAARDNQKTLRA